MHGHKVAVFGVDDDLRAAGGDTRHGNGIAGSGSRCFGRVGSRHSEAFVGCAGWCDVHRECAATACGAGAGCRRYRYASHRYRSDFVHFDGACVADFELSRERDDVVGATVRTQRSDVHVADKFDWAIFHSHPDTGLALGLQLVSEILDELANAVLIQFVLLAHFAFKAQGEVTVGDDGLDIAAAVRRI